MIEDESFISKSVQDRLNKKIQDAYDDLDNEYELTKHRIEDQKKRRKSKVARTNILLPGEWS